MKKLIMLVMAMLLLTPTLPGCGNSEGDKVQTTAAPTTTTTTTETEPSTEPETPAATPAEHFKWKELEDGTMGVRGYLGEDTGEKNRVIAEQVIIPSVVEGKTVTQILDEAFNGEFGRLDQLKSVTLPDTIQVIGSKAFYACAGLEKIDLPVSLTEIQSMAFMNCTSLKQVAIPSDCLKENAYDIFSGSGLERITLPDDLQILPNGVFSKTKLKEIALPAGVKVIASGAFASCAQLETVTLNQGLQSIGPAFSYCQNLKELIIPTTVTECSDYGVLLCEGLERIKFEGNAPQLTNIIEDPAIAHTVTVYYHEGATGFDGTGWEIYPNKATW